MSRTRDILNYDPLEAAEDITGMSYKADELTAGVGMLLAYHHGQRKEALLMSQDDTTLINQLDRYVAIITDMGFEQVLDVPFQSKWNEEGDDHLFVYVQKELGLLMVFDTYMSSQMNSGKVYYCWQPKMVDGRMHRGVTSSGGFCRYGKPDQYWAGDHDAREAIRFNIGQLREAGTFMRQWPSDNKLFLWFLHHTDTKDHNYDYEAINKERIAMLPKWVQEQFSLVD